MDIIGYEGLYTIAEDGTVFSIRKNKVIKGTKDTKLIVRFDLCKDNIIKKVKLNDLIEQHYPHVNIYNRPIVDGINIKYVVDFPNYIINRAGEIYSLKSDLYIQKAITKIGSYYACKLSNEKGRKFIKLHRLLALHFIPNPDNLPCVDHIDRNKLNNSLVNLRWVTKAQNNFNIKIRSDNTSGYIGVCWHKKDRKWIAQIGKVGSPFYERQEFITKEEAITCRREMEECHPDYFRN